MTISPNFPLTDSRHFKGACQNNRRRRSVPRGTGFRAAIESAKDLVDTVT